MIVYTVQQGLGQPRSLEASSWKLLAREDPLVATGYSTPDLDLLGWNVCDTFSGKTLNEDSMRTPGCPTRRTLVSVFDGDFHNGLFE